MSGLSLLEAFDGRWSSAVFLTYSLDLRFFEEFVYPPLFRNGCRNVLVLADWRRALEAMEHASQDTRVRWANRDYVLEPVRVPASLHAKVVLLAGPRGARILVGSGNLKRQGFVHGGEVFTRFDFASSGGVPEARFGVDLLNQLEGSHSWSRAAKAALEQLVEDAPWLYAPTPGASGVLVSSFRDSMLSQLRERLNGEAVEEIWVVSPFFDSEYSALRELVELIKPERTHLIVQEDRWPGDPARLAQTIKQLPCETTVYSLSDTRDRAIHAKIVLIKTVDRALCLTGSSNVSRSGFLLSVDRRGNVEASCCLSGGRNEFDSLLAGDGDFTLVPKAASDLSFGSPEVEDGFADIEELVATGCEREGNSLAVFFTGSMTPTGIICQCGSWEHTGELGLSGPGRAVATLPGLPAGVLYVWLTWIDGDTERRSNPVAAWDMRELEETRQGGPGLGDFDAVEDLDVPSDEELERVLHQLRNTLIVNAQDLRDLAEGRSQRSIEESDTPDEDLSYEDINWDMVRRHPRYSAYASQQLGSGRLRMLFDLVLAHFEKLESKRARRSRPAQASAEGEGEDAEVEEPATRRPVGQRLRRLLRWFVRNYLRGLESDRFRRMVGPAVMVHNYSLFSHLLWILRSRFDTGEDFVRDSYVRIWQGFWGSQYVPGYWHLLSSEERDFALGVVVSSNAHARTVAAVVAFARESERGHHGKVWLRLRPVVEAVTECLGPELLETAFEKAVVYLEEDPSGAALDPPAVRHMWQTLSLFNTDSNYLQEIRELPGVKSATFETVTVMVSGRPRAVKALRVETEGSFFEGPQAVLALRRWVEYDPLDYFRMTVSSGEVVFVDLQGSELVVKLGSGDVRRSTGITRRDIIAWPDVPLCELARLTSP